MRMLSLVEGGWQAARECSLAAQRDGVCVTHLIKGWVDPAVRRLHPAVPRIRMVSVARWWFWPWAWLLTAGWRFAGIRHLVLVDNERAQRRLRGWGQLMGTPVWLVRPGPDGYEMWAGAERLGCAPWRACGSP